ncbi:hypothetical protein KCP69_05270 [Salmonella enterica subsp. enterica]|nr:hypothetical protein KCP69_05270 [Salmonella enterica subsp. enterica]
MRFGALIFPALLRLLRACAFVARDGVTVARLAKVTASLRSACITVYALKEDIDAHAAQVVKFPNGVVRG